MTQPVIDARWLQAAADALAEADVPHRAIVKYTDVLAEAFQDDFDNILREIDDDERAREAALSTPDSR